MDAHTVLQRPCQQAVGIGLPQVGLGDKGQLVQVGHALDIIRGQPLLLHLFAVVGHVVPHIAHLLHQALALPGAELLLAGTFNLRLIITFHGDHLSSILESILFLARKRIKKNSVPFVHRGITAGSRNTRKPERLITSQPA